MSARKRNSLKRRVRRAYRQQDLANICVLPELKFGNAFRMETVRVTQHKYRQDYYHFRDNGSTVLAVAHLDTVVKSDGRKPYFGDTGSGPVIVSGALDDRLGAYVILKLLPALGVRPDWLLTIGEEYCASTAAYFEPAKDYNWVIEFDRGGTDVVMYQYETKAARLAVQAAGAVVGDGSYSDIASLEHLGVKAFNWGVGYRGNYHSVHGYAFLNDTFAMVAKFLRFWAQNEGLVMLHDPAEPHRWGYSYGRYDEYEYEYGPGGRSAGYSIYDGRIRECEICGAMAVDPDTDICADCGTCQGCFMKASDCLCYTEHEDGRALEDRWWARQDEDGAVPDEALTDEEYRSLYPADPADEEAAGASGGRLAITAGDKDAA